jgi:outer membrane lipoprotein-sorting protein
MFLALLCVAVCAAPVRSVAKTAQNRGLWSLESILARLDAEARDFHSLAADVERTKVTIVVNDRSTELGTILVRGDKMLLDMKTPDPRTILRTGETLYVYTPGLKRVEEYNLGKNKSAVDQFLLLGFGTAGAELKKGYLITVMPEVTIGDRKTVELELTPKSDAVRAQISKIQIWLDESTWLPVQQQFYETGSGDYSIVKYSKIVRNAAVPEADFKPHWPKGTEKIKPQGM